MKKMILSDKDFSENEETAKHKEWYLKFKDNYKFTEENTEEILKEEIGKTFVRVLSDSGVYKNTKNGRAAFLRFVERINSIGG